MADFVPVSGEAKVDDNASKGDVHFAAAEALLALSAAPTDPQPVTPMKQTASPSKTAKTPTSKHTPIMPKGTKFRWEDNMKYWNIKKGSAFNLDTVTPQNLIITLTSIDGKVITYSRNEIGSPQWDSIEWIRQSNRWFDQVLLRCLEKNVEQDGKSRKRAERAVWSITEKDHLEKLIRERTTGGQEMSPADWKFVLENHNKEFEGHILKKGEKLVSSFGRSKDLLVKEDRVLKERSMLALKAQAKRWGLFTKAFAGVKDGQAEMDTDTETDEVSSD